MNTGKLVFVGASTGGTEAIREFLSHMPADAPAILIAQHMPAGFTQAFAARLSADVAVCVKEAENGERIAPGYAYIAPGGRHLKLGRHGPNYVIVLDDGPPVNRHRPSVEVLFRSAAALVGRNAVGVILTGMGCDGAGAMREMKDAGAYNVAQDEASCVVFGMPREAIAAGAIHTVLPLADISAHVLQHVMGQ